MTARALALLMLAASTPACGSAPEEPMAIPDVIARIDALNGRMVQVVGYLGECRGYECSLYRNQTEQAQADRYYGELMAAAHQGRRPSVTTLELPWLGIGEGENRDFDRKAAPFQNSYVVITGRVTNACRYRGESSCTDRTTDLVPTDIRRGQPSASTGAGR